MSGGGSKSQQQTSTSNIDNRIAAENGSINVAGSTNVNITATDHGAVAGALDLAKAGVEGANKTTQQTIEAGGELLSGAMRMVGEQQQQFTSALENIKTSDVRTLVITGMGVVAVAAAVMFGKKG